MDAIRRTLVATLVAAALCAAPAQAGPEAPSRARGTLQVTAVVEGRCDFSTDPAAAPRCNRGVAFEAKTVARERQQVEELPGAAAPQPVLVRQIDF